ncbi:PepSY domain-containing protein, partial [Microbacterium aurantiacum]
ASAPAAGSGAEADVVAQYEAARAAVDLAERTAGGKAFELDDEDGGNWEVRVAVENEEFEVVVDAAGTEVLRSERDDSLDGEDAGRLNGVQIGLSEAIGIAVSEYTGTARLDDADLTTEGDTVAWEIGFVDDVEIYLDVLDGRVIRVD